MTKRYYNKGYINEIVSQIYDFVGNKNVGLLAISDLYADSVAEYKYCQPDYDVYCNGCNITYKYESLNIRKFFVLKFIRLYASREFTKEEFINFFNNIKL